uniref:EF-hand domain-containing protein n=1 Tax=Heterorhabditis bacteriophora TaxID=37862 RepID=A0A1I7XLR6_HETBA
MAYQLMAYIDANGDNKLNINEMKAFSNLFSRTSEADLTKLFNHLDADGDTFLTIAELDNLPSKITNLLNLQPPPVV